MRRLAFVFCLLAAGEAAWSASDRANLFSFRAPDGWGEVEWISGSSFRWTRVWGRALEKGRPIKAEPVEVSRKDLGDRWEFTSNYLVVEVEKSGLKFRVMSAEGKVLAEMLTVRQEPGAVVLEFGAEKSERYYGLGVRAAAELNLRGQVVRAGKPFLVSSLGYGEYYGAPGNYVFDLAQGQAERRQVRIEGGDRVEYYFHYGPSPKEVLEEQMALGTPGADLKAADFGILEAAAVPAGVGKLAAPGEASWTSLRDSIHSLMHAGLSAVLASAFDLGPYLGAEGALLERATQLGGGRQGLERRRPAGSRGRRFAPAAVPAGMAGSDAAAGRGPAGQAGCREGGRAVRRGAGARGAEGHAGGEGALCGVARRHAGGPAVGDLPTCGPEVRGDSGGGAGHLRR